MSRSQALRKQRRCRHRSRASMRSIGPRSAADLDKHGCAVTGPLLTADECAALAGRYPEDALFRSRVIMARHGFGRGEYKYFAYPLPDLDRRRCAPRSIRRSPRSPTAGTRRWASRSRYPAEHAAFLERCHKAGQTQADAAAAAIRRRRLQLPAPGPLRRARVSAAGHGPAVAAGRGFLRRRVRADRAAAAHAVARRGRAAAQGEAVIFPVHHRPVQGTRGVYRVNMRHGVSRIRDGQRHTLGIIFHDAK